MIKDYKINDCRIRACEKIYDTYSVNSCDDRFSVGSMCSVYSTDSFEKANEWIKNNTKNFKNLYLEGFFVK